MKERETETERRERQRQRELASSFNALLVVGGHPVRSSRRARSALRPATAAAAGTAAASASASNGGEEAVDSVALVHADREEVSSDRLNISLGYNFQCERRY